MTLDHMFKGTPLSYSTCQLLARQLPPHQFNYQSSLVLHDNTNKSHSPHCTTAKLLLWLMLLCKLLPSTPVLSCGRFVHLDRPRRPSHYAKPILGGDPHTTSANATLPYRRAAKQVSPRVPERADRGKETTTGGWL